MESVNAGGGALKEESYQEESGNKKRGVVRSRIGSTSRAPKTSSEETQSRMLDGAKAIAQELGWILGGTVPEDRKHARFKPPSEGGQYGISGLQFSADGQFLAFGTTSGVAGIWNLKTERMQVFLGRIARAVTYVGFSRDGDLETIGNSGVRKMDQRQREVLFRTDVLQTWSTSDGDLLNQRVLSDEDSDADEEFPPKPNEKYFIQGVSDGSELVSGARAGNPILIRPTGRFELEHEGASLDRVILSFETKTLITLDALGILRVWDLQAPQMPGSIFVGSLASRPFVSSISLAPDKKSLAVGFWDGTFCVSSIAEASTTGE